MKDFLEILTRIAKANEENVFFLQSGYVLGVIACITLFIIVAIVYWVFFKYPRRQSGVTIRAPRGSVFVSSHAIADLIESLEEDFKDIEIKKVTLLNCKKFLRLEIQVNYGLGGEPMPAIAESLQEKAVNALNYNFGISSVKDISIRVKRAPSAK